MSGTAADDGEEPPAFRRVCEDLVEQILDGEVGRDELESAKLDACSEHSGAEEHGLTRLRAGGTA